MYAQQNSRLYGLRWG